MANPIIKIKRGVGVPPMGSNGLTAGEFAFDRISGILYLGLSGLGYSAISELANSEVLPQSIPIGMQISNDSNFGSGGNLNDRIGYSERTVPTTKAVREYVNLVKAQETLGITLRAGPGIGITYAADGSTTDITISNTGTTAAYRTFNFYGSNSGFNSVSAGTSADILKLSAEKGIHFTVGDSGGFDHIQFYNTGVREISGVTGDITAIEPIVKLDGFTLAVGTVIQQSVSALSPLYVAVSEGTGQIQLEHLDSGVVGGNFAASDGNGLYLKDISVNSKGHITSITNVKLNLVSNDIGDFTEAAQDAIWNVNAFSTRDGLTLTYDDAGSRATLFNRGITAIGITGSAGLTGMVWLGASLGIQLIGNGKDIYIASTNPIFKTITVGKASDLYVNGTPPAGSIWLGGTTGPGTQIVDAEKTSDTLKLYAGKGIGISAGEYGTNLEDTIMFWNTGVNRITAAGFGYSGDVQLSAGTNITLTDIGNNVLQISSSGGGQGTGSLNADYGNTAGTNLINFFAGSGITGNIEVIGTGGILTEQTVNVTKDGSLFIGPSSRLILPARKFIGYDADPTSGNLPTNYPSVIQVPLTSETKAPAFTDVYGGLAGVATIGPLVYDSTYNAGLTSPHNKVIVEQIQSNLTANITNFDTSSAWGLSQLSGGVGQNAISLEPGKILRLVAKSGSWSKGPSITQAPQAEIRLIGWPASEHLGSELQSIVNAANPPAGQNPCGFDDGGNATQYGCKGFPTKLPTCYDSGNWTNYFIGSADRPTSKFNTNVVVNESLLVHKDIWLNGNIIDAETGCLITLPGGQQQQSAICIECLGNGNVGITGYARIDNDLYVYGDDALFFSRGGFKGSTFAVDTDLVYIGGATGGNLFPTSGISGSQSDKGLMMINRAALVATPINAGIGSTNIGKRSFTGIRQADGVFTYIPDATVLTSGTGVDSKTSITGIPGPARFASINSVGITATSAGAAEFKVTTNGSSFLTNSSILGNVNISGPNASTSTNNITFSGQNTNLLFTSNAASQTIGFATGVSFSSGSIDGGTGAFIISTQNPNASTTDLRIAVRRVSSGSHWVEVVDTGRYLSSGGGGGNNAWGTTIGPKQILYNKTLADDCVIDCGTY